MKKKIVIQNLFLLNRFLFKVYYCTVTAGKTISICPLYLPSSEAIIFYQLEYLLCQLPVPCTILRDFNAHHTLWGSTFCNKRGNLLFYYKQ